MCHKLHQGCWGCQFPKHPAQHSRRTQRQRKDVPSNHIDKLLFFVQVKGVFNTMYMCCFPRNLFPPNQNDSTKVLKVANRFEILINQRKNMEEYKDMNDLEILQSIAGRYKQLQSHSRTQEVAVVCWLRECDCRHYLGSLPWSPPRASKSSQPQQVDREWKLDGNCGIYGLFFFLGAFGKSITRQQPGFFWLWLFVFSFWPCPGYSEALLRLKRHQLNESPKGLDATWTKMLTDSWIEMNISKLITCFVLVRCSQHGSLLAGKHV